MPVPSFVRTLTAQQSLSEESRIVCGRTVTERRGGSEEVRQVAEDELVPMRDAAFGISLPKGTRLPPIASRAGSRPASRPFRTATASSHGTSSS